jgi:hypothetical protein
MSSISRWRNGLMALSAQREMVTRLEQMAREFVEPAATL